MRVLVTGAGGFVGARLAADLTAVGHEVTGAWHQSRERLLNRPPATLAYRRVDLADAVAVDALMSEKGRFDAIVHAAAVLANVEDSDYLRRAARANVLVQANLIAAAGETGCGRFVFTSSISVYGNRSAPAGGYREADVAPASYYGWSKRAGEEVLNVAAAAHGMTCISLRLAGVHGLGRTSGALYAMTRAALNGQPIAVTEPKSCFRWVFIEDVSQAIARALTADLPGGHHIVNLASADSFTLGELAGRVKDAIGSNSSIEANAGAESRNEVMNIDRAKTLLGYVPTPLDRFLPTYVGELRRA